MENGGPAGIEFVLLNNPVARLGDGMGSAVIGDCFLLFSRQVFQKAIAPWFSGWCFGVHKFGFFSGGNFFNHELARIKANYPELARTPGGESRSIARISAK